MSQVTMGDSSTARQLQMAGDHHVGRNEQDLAQQHHPAFAHDVSRKDDSNAMPDVLSELRGLVKRGLAS